MQSAIARQAEAERNRRAKVINSEGEFQAAAKLADAAGVIEPNPVTLQLRYLQALTEISTNPGSTIVFPLPLDVVRPLLEAGARNPRAEQAEERPAEPSALPESGAPPEPTALPEPADASDGSQEALSRRT
jgi:regulator of protease activity HflC (stomatin/prohibitin superfamily)